MGLLSAFLRDERGSYTIEFCLWIPMFLFFLAATVDASLLYLTHNNMWNAARDAARRASVQEMTWEEVQNHLAGTLLLGGNTYYMPPEGTSVTEDGPKQGFDGSEVTVAIQTTIADASLFNIFGAVNWWWGSYSPGSEGYACNDDGNIMGCALHAQVTMPLEPPLSTPE